MNPGIIPLSQPHNYVSEEQQPAANSVYTFSLPVAAIPDYVRVVAVCKTAEEGYVKGDEIDSPGLTAFAPNAHVVIVAAPGLVTVLVGAVWHTQHKITAVRAALSFVNWRLKVYAGWLSPFA
jgi:hypothetical protein